MLARAPILKVGSIVRGKTNQYLNKVGNVKAIKPGTTGKRFGVVWDEGDDEADPEYVTRRALSLIVHDEDDVKSLSDCDSDFDNEEESDEGCSDSDAFMNDDTADEEEEREEGGRAAIGGERSEAKKADKDLLNIKGLKWTKVDSIPIDRAADQAYSGKLKYLNLAGRDLKSVTFLEMLIDNMYPRMEFQRTFLPYINKKLESRNLIPITEQTWLRWLGILLAMVVQPMDNRRDFWNTTDDYCKMAPNFGGRFGMSLQS